MCRSVSFCSASYRFREKVCIQQTARRACWQHRRSHRYWCQRHCEIIYVNPRVVGASLLIFFPKTMAMKDSVRHLLPTHPSQPQQLNLSQPPEGSQSGVSPLPTPGLEGAPATATATPSQPGTPVPAFGETGPPTRTGSPTPAVAVPKPAATPTTAKGGATGDAELLSTVDVPAESSKIPLDVAIMASLSTAQTEDRVKRLVSGLLLVGGSSLIPGSGWAIQSR
jgi:actin-related protein 8